MFNKILSRLDNSHIELPSSPNRKTRVRTRSSSYDDENLTLVNNIAHNPCIGKDSGTMNKHIENVVITVDTDNDRLHNTDSTITCIYLVDNNKIKHICVFLYHICVQLSLLSVLEPLLFFFYIVQIEESLFYKQMSKLISQVNGLIDTHDALCVREMDEYIIFMQVLQDNDTCIDSLYYELESSAERGNIEQEHLSHELMAIALRFAFIIISITFIYSVVLKYVFNEKIVPILMHHISLIVFIGIYEVWFFSNVIIKYIPWTDDEIIFYIFQCLWQGMTNKFPELQQLQCNSITMDCHF